MYTIRVNYRRGITAKVGMEPDGTLEAVIVAPAKVYRHESHQETVTLVLVVTNLSFLGTGDLLHNLFAED